MLRKGYHLHWGGKDRKKRAEKLGQQGGGGERGDGRHVKSGQVTLNVHNSKKQQREANSIQEKTHRKERGNLPFETSGGKEDRAGHAEQ